ncbi:hypothetical protein Tco_0435445 [Tanacetum coccineum]
MHMESSATREYPWLIHTFFLTHTVGGEFVNPEDKALYIVTQLESHPEYGGSSGSDGCGDDDPVDDEDGGEDGEDEDDMAAQCVQRSELSSSRDGHGLYINIPPEPELMGLESVAPCGLGSSKEDLKGENPSKRRRRRKRRRKTRRRRSDSNGKLILIAKSYAEAKKEQKLKEEEKRKKKKSDGEPEETLPPRHPRWSDENLAVHIWTGMCRSKGMRPQKYQLRKDYRNMNREEINLDLLFRKVYKTKEEAAVATSTS